MDRTMRLIKAFIIKTFILLLLFSNINAWAKSSDKDAAIHIEADQLEMRERESLSIYRGNVKISKGSIKISGEEIIIKNKNGILYKIDIKGSPAVFFQLNDLGEAIEAQSLQMHYFAETGILELKEKALLVKDKNRFSSEHIIYDTQKNIITAGRGKNKQTGDLSTAAEIPRVKVTIHPETKPQITKEATKE